MLPTDAKARKDTPIYSGVRRYFPLALAAIARVSKKGNDQHNPGEPLRWSREKSSDHLDSLDRHLTDYAGDVKLDSDGESHLAHAGWRLLAQLELDEEARLAAPQCVCVLQDKTRFSAIGCPVHGLGA